MTLYLVVLGIIIPKNRVAKLPKSYLIFYRNHHHAKFEIDRTILTCLNYLKDLTDTDVLTDSNHSRASLLKIV